MNASVYEPGFITLENITKTFGEGEDSIRVVEPLMLRIAKGEFVVFVGPSGCGKTTVMRMIGGLEKPTGGRITLAGQPITGQSREKGMVFQSYSSFPWLTVLNNVRFGLKYRETSGRQKRNVSRDIT